MKRIPMYAYLYQTHEPETYALCTTGKGRFKGMYLWQEVRRTIFGIYVKTKSEPFWLDNYGFTYIGCGRFYGDIPIDNPNICEEEA